MAIQNIVEERRSITANAPNAITSVLLPVGILFHKVKFSLLKAFYIVYYVSTNKKGISSTELSRILGLRQKTCWLFKQKLMIAIRSSSQSLMHGKAEVDETLVGDQEEGVVGRKNKKKKLVVFAIERKGLFDNLLNRRLVIQPYTYKMIMLKCLINKIAF